MTDLPTLHTAADVAKHLRMSRTTFSALLRNLGYHGKQGRRRFFTDADIQMLFRARSCLSHCDNADGTKYGMPAARSVSVATRLSQSENSTLDAFLKLTQKPSRKEKSGASAMKPRTGQRTAQNARS